MVRWSVISAVLFFAASAKAQEPREVIQLFNPSFEDFARCCQPPTGWRDCGFQGETPPDVQPAGGFSVNRPAQDGRTYMGMVTRDNDTWESVEQRLEYPLEKNSCYSFSIHLCRSDVYVSGTSTNRNQLESFTNPIKLRIWGGTGSCTKRELLGESELIRNIEWKKFDFKFEPNSTITYIILEAFYKTPTLLPYNGNILIDNASDIVLIPCKEEETVVKASPDNKTTSKTIVKNKPQPKEAVVASKTPSKVLNLDRKNVSKGQSFIIQNLYFESDSTVIPTDCYAVLDELHDFLHKNQDIIIEIAGHTNGIPKDDYCDKLSLARAKAVATYIAGKGIPWRRLYYRGYGKKKLIASDATPEGRKKNQRVEFKILHMNS